MEAQRREDLAARIKELREPRPQQAIADKVGVSLRAYQAWEAGGGISWENLEQLAKALGVTEEYLLYGEAGDRARTSTQLQRIETKLDALTAAVARLAPAGAQEARVAEALRDADEVERQLDAGELPSDESAVATGNRRAAAARRR